MVIRAFKGDGNSAFVGKAAPPLILAHLDNATWLRFWLNAKTGITVIATISIVHMLSLAVTRWNMERWNGPTNFIVSAWWPIDLYFGRISVYH